MATLHDPFIDEDYDGSKGGAYDEDEYGGACPTLVRSYRAHRRQYRIGACCGLSFALLMIAVFVGGAAVAQSAINGSGMAISGMRVRDMTDGGFRADLNLTVDNRSPLGASLGASTLDMTFGGEVVGTMELPAMALGAAASTDFVFEGVRVGVGAGAQATAFGKFGAALINAKTLSLGTRGGITVGAAGMSFSLTLDKKVEIKGVAGFASPPPLVLSQHIVSAGANEIVLSMDVQMSNPSTASFADVGALAFEVRGVGGAKLGVAKADSAHNAMAPGVNNYTFPATLNRVKGSGKGANEAAFLKVLSDFAAGDTCTVTMAGTEDSTGFALLKPALLAVNLEVSFNGLATLKVPDRRFTSNPVINANGVIDPLVPTDQRAFVDLSAASATRATCAAPSVMANSWARVAIFPLITTQVNVSCPVLDYTNGTVGEGEMRATPFCPDGQKSTGNADASAGPIAGAYMVAYVMVENPTPLAIELHKLDAELRLVGDPNPPAGFELFNESQPLARAIDYPGKVSPVPHTDGTVGTRVSPSPLLTVPAHGRAVYQITACVTSCVGFLSGTGSAANDSPGWLGSSLPSVAPTFAKSYLNMRFYPEVDAADWFSEERGPMSASVSMAGKTTLSMGNLTNLELDLKQPYLPMTAYASAF